jgi:hypothetical protein
MVGAGEVMPDEQTDATQASLWPELVEPVTPGARAVASRPPRLCKQCGEPVPAPAGSRVYCSPACRKRAQPPRRAAGATDGEAASRAAGHGAAPTATDDPAAEVPPAPRAAPPELTPHRRLVLAWQLLSSYRPAALWQALELDEQAQAAAITLAMYQWVRELEPFARRHRGGS